MADQSFEARHNNVGMVSRLSSPYEGCYTTLGGAPLTRRWSESALYNSYIRLLTRTRPYCFRFAFTMSCYLLTLLADLSREPITARPGMFKSRRAATPYL